MLFLERKKTCDLGYSLEKIAKNKKNIKNPIKTVYKIRKS